MIEIAIEAAKSGGKILLENFGRIKQKDIETKSKNNFVTFVDRSSEEKIIGVIHKYFPEHTIYAEESGKNQKSSEYRWLIDPLDGTSNYINEIPVFSISIALEKNGELIMGLIYEPLKNDIFHAEKGKGAFLNREEIRISPKSDINESVIATGFPYKDPSQIENYLKLFSKFMHNTAGLRRMGSAAIDLAYTAAGRFDGFWELSLSPWDIAAGIVIIEEAGGVVSDTSGTKEYLKSGNIIASNQKIHQQMLNLLK